jgi:hypothetical protein
MFSAQKIAKAAGLMAAVLQPAAVDGLQFLKSAAAAESAAKIIEAEQAREGIRQDIREREQDARAAAAERREEGGIRQDIEQREKDVQDRAAEQRQKCKDVGLGQRILVVIAFVIAFWILGGLWVVWCVPCVKTCGDCMLYIFTGSQFETCADKNCCSYGGRCGLAFVESWYGCYNGWYNDEHY